METTLLFFLTFLAAGSSIIAAANGYSGFYYRYASCEFVPGVDANAEGTVLMRQKVPTRKYYGVYKQYYPLEIYVNAKITSSNPGIREHGLHVHTYGDLANSCSAAGGHYNPLNTNHGGPSDPFDKRHVGDWGNTKEVNGTIQSRFLDYLAPLYGPYSIYGRAIVLHEGTDDLGRGGNEGSLATGNAGRRLACCTIRHVGAKNF